MAELRVSLFGFVQASFTGSDSGSAQEIHLTQSIQRLLAYLMIFRARLHSREALAEVFWANHAPDKARNNLNTALWRLQHTMTLAGMKHANYLVSTPYGELGFNCNSPFWLDVDEFERETRLVLNKDVDSLTADDAQRLKNSLQLYKGDLLENIFEDWAIQERERLRLIYLSILEYLVHYHDHRAEWDQSLGYACQILSCDPLREEVHREIMQLHMKAGNRALAIRQYELCRSLLLKEMGISPMVDTQLLYEQVLNEPRSTGRPLTGRHNQLLQDALTELRAAEQCFLKAQQQLARVILSLENHETLH